MKLPYKIVLLLLIINLLQLSCTTKQKPTVETRLEINISSEEKGNSINQIKIEKEITKDTVLELKEKVTAEIETAKEAVKKATSEIKETTSELKNSIVNQLKEGKEEVVNSIESVEKPSKKIVPEISKEVINKVKILSVITPSEFMDKSKGHTIIDVRTPYEYKHGYIKGSENINYYDRNFSAQMSKFNKEEPIYIYCKSGNRSSSASEKLSKLGFKEVYDMKGGIQDWKKNELPIEK